MGKECLGFMPKKGFRKGNQLSPYLFILFIEMFSSTILVKNLDGKREPIRAAGNGSGLLRFFFADDNLLFIKSKES